jgi:hypothetical protein
MVFDISFKSWKELDFFVKSWMEFDFFVKSWMEFDLQEENRIVETEVFFLSRIAL